VSVAPELEQQRDLTPLVAELRNAVGEVEATALNLLRWWRSCELGYSEKKKEVLRSRLAFEWTRIGAILQAEIASFGPDYDDEEPPSERTSA
jgi:hypothetical protein